MAKLRSSFYPSNIQGWALPNCGPFDFNKNGANMKPLLPHSFIKVKINTERLYWC